MTTSTTDVLRKLSSDLSSVTLVQLPAMIVECFTKLWFEVQENSHIEELVPRERFRMVFESMNTVFAGDAPQMSTKKLPSPERSACTGICKSLATCSSRQSISCDTCEEDYALVNNDVEYSFFVHAQTEKHVEIVRTYQLEMMKAASLNERDGLVDSRRSTPFCSRPQEEHKSTTSTSYSASRSDLESPFLEKNGIVSLDCMLEENNDQYFCMLCDIMLADREQMKKHTRSKSHQKEAQKNAATLQPSINQRTINLTRTFSSFGI